MSTHLRPCGSLQRRESPSATIYAVVAKGRGLLDGHFASSGTPEETKDEIRRHFGLPESAPVLIQYHHL